MRANHQISIHLKSGLVLIKERPKFWDYLFSEKRCTLGFLLLASVAPPLAASNIAKPEAIMSKVYQIIQFYWAQSEI